MAAPQTGTFTPVNQAGNATKPKVQAGSTVQATSGGGSYAFNPANWQSGLGTTSFPKVAAPATAPAATPAAATTQPAAAPSGVGNVTTSITPTGVYSPDQTQQAINQAQASAAQNADPRWQQKQFMTPGRSMDAGTYQAALPGMTSALFGGQQAAAQQPLTDAFANQQQLQAGQIAQQGEAQGLANNMATVNENNINQRNQLIQPVLGMLGQYMNM